MLYAEDFNRIYQALGLPDRAVNCELAAPHIDRACEEIAGLVERSQADHNKACGAIAHNTISEGI